MGRENGAGGVEAYLEAEAVAHRGWEDRAA